VFVALSQNSAVAGEPVLSTRTPSSGCRAASAASVAAVSCGRPASAVSAPASGPQLQVSRNHSVGSRCSVAASGPALVTRTRTHTSSGEAFA